MPVFFLGALIGLIVSVFVSVGSAIVSVLAVVVPIFVQVFSVIKSVVAQIASGAGRFFRFIADAARSLYADVLKPIVDAARTYYARVKQFLQSVFGPIIEIFESIQRFLNKVWTDVIAPILDALDKARMALRLLARLGVPFVAKIEEVLQRIQSEIFKRFQQVQGWLNTVTFWLDILLDPRGWIRATPFLYTVFRFGGNIVNVITKLADLSGLNRGIVERERAENPTLSVNVIVERVKSGAIRESDAVQTAAARFRSGQSGRVA